MTNKQNELLALILVIISTLGAIVAVLGYEHFRVTRPNLIIIKTFAPEDGNFQPSHFEMVAGREYTIEIRNPQTFSHGFAIPALGAGVQEIKPGHVERITLTPATPGTFEFMCATWCTVNHMRMRGTVTVLPPDSVGTPETSSKQSAP